MGKRVIRTEQGAPPLGAYSQGWHAGDFVFVSGTGPIGPDGKVTGADIEEQPHRTIDNVEAVPSNCEGVMYPIHAIGVNAMGLYFLDSLYLEDLAAACASEGRSEFLCVIAPLRLAGGTGSPVNPIAVL